MGFAGVISALTGVIYGLGEEQTKLALFHHHGIADRARNYGL